MVLILLIFIGSLTGLSGGGYLILRLTRAKKIKALNKTVLDSLSDDFEGEPIVPEKKVPAPLLPLLPENMAVGCAALVAGAAQDLLRVWRQYLVAKEPYLQYASAVAAIDLKLSSLITPRTAGDCQPFFERLENLQQQRAALCRVRFPGSQARVVGNDLGKFKLARQHLSNLEEQYELTANLLDTKRWLDTYQNAIQSLESDCDHFLKAYSKFETGGPTSRAIPVPDCAGLLATSRDLQRQWVDLWGRILEACASADGADCKAEPLEQAAPDKPDTAQVECYLSAVAQHAQSDMDAARRRHVFSSEAKELFESLWKSLSSAPEMSIFEDDCVEWQAVVAAQNWLKTWLLSKKEELKGKLPADSSDVKAAVTTALPDERNYLAALRAQSRTVVMAQAAYKLARQRRGEPDKAPEPPQLAENPPLDGNDESIDRTLRAFEDWSRQAVKSQATQTRLNDDVTLREGQLVAAIAKLGETAKRAIDSVSADVVRTDSLLVALRTAKWLVAWFTPRSDSHSYDLH